MQATSTNESQDRLQFYPTGKELAKKAWLMFREKNVTRLLEPSAGRGDLVMANLPTPRHEYHTPRLGFEWDAVEIDTSHHPLLRERGASVVGHDFLAMTDCTRYSHILMNPPFNQGVKHVLHAWNKLFEGEIVAIINAQSLRNLCSSDRIMLATLVASHGRVEFIQDAFKGDDVLRKAEVEIALIHLEKTADRDSMVGDILSGLKKDGAGADHLDWTAPQELALPTNFVESTVRNFDLAVLAAKDAAIATARAGVYVARLGKTMATLQRQESGEENKAPSPSGVAVRSLYAHSYEQLKDAAWTQILRSTHVLSRLSYQAQKRVESEFENIKTLEFTVSNVYGFLHGLVQNASDIQQGMVCDVFDQITRYHTCNAVYFMGWKSNDRHRTAGMRVKSTRFVIPSEAHSSWRSKASWDVLRWLGDFDRVFAMLDGKHECQNGLVGLFESDDTYMRLVQGERLSSEYFDVRYYPGRGTIHFFPRRMDTIERLNRVVGQYRKWLPPSMDDMDPDFRTQYEQAEKFNTEFLAAVASKQTGHWGRNFLLQLTSNSEESRTEAHKLAYSALEEVLDRHGIHPQGQLGTTAKPDKLMLAA